MRLTNLVTLSITICIAALIAGCGAGGTSPEKKNAAHESTACISCHEDPSWQTPGTKINVVAEWKLSTHNTKNGASCGDCHGSGFSHPASCNKCHTIGAAFNPIKNPDLNAECAKCHSKTTGFTTTNVDGIAINTGIAHFTNLTTGTIRRVTQSLYYTNYTSSYKITNASGGTAVLVSSLYTPVKGSATKYGCRACHNPHDTSSQIDYHRAWSRSGHGDTNSGSRTSRYFKSSGSNLPASITMGSVCVRCHTSTGFINYINSDYIAVNALDTANTADHTKELTGCNVCHDDGNGYSYSYKLRNVLAANPSRTGVPAFYNYSPARGGNARTIPSTNVNISLTYPDSSKSNICIVCHMGREIGQSVKRAFLLGVTFTGTARISAHDFAAGANLYQESGFEFYTSAAKYPQTAFLHNLAGMGNFNGTGNNGPCISCHMSRQTAKSANSHSFMPINKAVNSHGRVESIASNACNKCHPIAASGKIMDAAALENNRQGFLAAMRSLRDLIRIKIAGVTMPNTKTGALSYATSINWTLACGSAIVAGSGNPVTGGADAIGAAAYTMGSAFNYELLYADFGAYVHNPNYVRRLIFDSIDWLNDCSITTSNGATECSNITDPLAKAYLCPTGVRP